MHITALYTYPIKSIRGCTLQSQTATPTGFNYDRRFMLQRLDDHGKVTNMHVSQYPEMCLFTTELTSSSLDPHDTSGTPTTIKVRYTKPHVFDHVDDSVGNGSLEVPLQPDTFTLQGLEEVEVVMHRSPTVGFDMGGHFNAWFSRWFGYNVRLLYVGPNRRKVLGSVAPSHESHRTSATACQSSDSASTGGWLGSIRANVGAAIESFTKSDDKSTTTEAYKAIDNGIGFADCAPFLVVNTKSGENASRRLLPNDDDDDEGMDITKFRPNIVVEGVEEFEEDYWAELRVGCARIVLTANCARCASLNVDYATGKMGTGKAGSILKKLQKDRRVDEGAKYSPIFGRYGFLALDQGAGEGAGVTDRDGNVEIRVGDAVEVVRRNEKRTRFRWPGLGTDR